MKGWRPVETLGIATRRFEGVERGGVVLTGFGGGEGEGVDQVGVVELGAGSTR